MVRSTVKKGSRCREHGISQPSRDDIPQMWRLLGDGVVYFDAIYPRGDLLPVFSFFFPRGARCRIDYDYSHYYFNSLRFVIMTINLEIATELVLVAF